MNIPKRPLNINPVYKKSLGNKKNRIQFKDPERAARQLEELEKSQDVEVIL